MRITIEHPGAWQTLAWVILPTLCIVACATTPRGQERQIRGKISKAWILLDDDVPYLKKMIRLAPEYRIDSIQISHDMCMFAEQILDDEKRAAEIRELVDLGNSFGLEMYIWSHEIAGLPEEFKPREDDKIDLDDPRLFEWIEDKYDRLFQTLPDLSGIVMTYSETDVKIFDDARVRSALDHSERITKLTNAIHAACKRRGKKLIARDWANVGTGKWNELLEFEEGLWKSDPEVVVMTKHTAGDWYLLADNPLMGSVAPHRQICEFDLAGEHHGLQIIPWCHPNYIEDRWEWARSKGVVGAAARTERHERHVLGTPGEVNLYAFSEIIDNPKKSTDKIWHEWATKEYGPKAADKVVSALKRTDEIVLKTFYARRVYWGSSHSRIPQYAYLHNHLKGKTAVPFDPSFAPVEKSLLEPDESTLQWVLQEKDEALALVEASLRDIEDAREDLKRQDYLDLKDALEHSHAICRLFRCINECYFYVRFHERNLDGRSKYWADRFRESLPRLIAARDHVFARWGTDFIMGDHDTKKDRLAPSMEKLISQMKEKVEEVPSRE